MKRHKVNNNPEMKRRTEGEEISLQEMIFFWLQEMGCQSIRDTTCDTEGKKVESYSVNFENESVSMFFVKDENEFLSVLGLGEEGFHV